MTDDDESDNDLADKLMSLEIQMIAMEEEQESKNELLENQMIAKEEEQESKIVLLETQTGSIKGQLLQNQEELIYTQWRLYVAKVITFIILIFLMTFSVYEAMFHDSSVVVKK